MDFIWYLDTLYLEPLISFMLEIGLHKFELVLKNSDFLKKYFNENRWWTDPLKPK